MFNLEIKTENEAFGTTTDERNAEVIRILKKVIEKLEDNNNWDLALKDANGNTVGSYHFKAKW
jgi:hypothetical protein